MENNGKPAKRANGCTGRKPKSPKIHYRGVRARWSERLGAWTFRAMITVDGRRVPGEQRLTQEDAADDYRRLRATAEVMPLHVSTLGEALSQVAADARARGVPERTVKLAYEAHGRYLCRFFNPDARMSALTKGEILWLVREARECGRSPNTLIQKDLPLLARCFRAAQLPDIVPDVRQELRQTLKRVPPKMHFFEPEEIRNILVRMRKGVFRIVELRCPSCKGTFTAPVEDRDGDQRKRCPKKSCERLFTTRSRRRGRKIVIESREADADLVEFLARTGIRAGELGRVMLSDIDRGTIQVVSKDRGHPREIDVIKKLEPVVDRIRRRALRRAGGRNADTERVPFVNDSMNRITNLCRRWKVRLDEPRLSGRTLRHSFVTGVLYAGATPAEARGAAGHRQLSTTDRYTHEISQRRGQVLEAWSDRLDGDDEADATEAAG